MLVLDNSYENDTIPCEYKDDVLKARITNRDIIFRFITQRYTNKPQKKRRVTVASLLFILAPRDSHQTKPNDIYKKDYLIQSKTLNGNPHFRFALQR